MGIDLNWTATAYPASLDATAGSFPTLVDGVHNILASHPNSLASAVEAVEGKVGVDDSAVVTTFDYVLKKGRHTSKQPGLSSGSVAFVFDTLVAHSGTDDLFSWRSASTERMKIGGGGATDTYVELGFGSAAPVGAAGKARLRVNEGTGRLELSNNGGPYVPIAVDSSGGFVTLDDAYDAGGAGLGRTITADSGAVVINNAVADATNALEITRSNGTGVAVVIDGGTVGTTGAEVRLRHNDGDVGVAGDVLGRLSGWGADDTTPGTMREYGRVNFRIADPLAATTIGEFTMNLRYGGGVRHVLTVRARSTSTDSGCVLENHKTDSTDPSWEFTSTSDIGAANPLVRMSDVSATVWQLYGGGDIQQDGVVTGTTGPEYQLRHNDGEVGVANDVLGSVSFWGADDTTPGTMREYTRTRHIIKTATAGTEDGATDLWFKTGGTIGRALRISGLSAAAEQRVQFTNQATAGALAYFTFTCTADIGSTGQAVLVEDGGGTLFYIQGDGAVRTRWAGSVTSSSLGYDLDPDTGPYWPASNQFGIATGGRATANFATDIVTFDGTSTGTTGVELKLRHNDGEVGAANDILANISWWGNNTTPSIVQYAGVRSVIVGAAPANESGRLDVQLMTAGTLASVLKLFGSTAAADTGVIMRNDAAAGVTAFTFRAVSDYGSTQSVFSFEDNNGTVLLKVDGVGLTTHTGAISLIDGSTGAASPAIYFTADTDLGIYRQAANNFGIAADTLTIRSPASDPATTWLNNAGTALFSLGVAGGVFAAFTTGSTFNGWRFQSTIAPNANPVADFIGYSGPWGAGQPLLSASNDIAGGTPANARVFQVDGDGMVTMTRRVTGTSGPEHKLVHNDGEVGVAADRLGRLSFWGADGTTAGTMRNYVNIDGVINIATAASTTGQIDFRALDLTVASRFFSIRPDGTAAAEGGVLIDDRVTTSGSQAFTFYRSDASATVGPIVGAWRDSSSAAASDEIGSFSMAGSTDGGAGTFAAYAAIRGVILDPAASSKDGAIRFKALGGNSQRTIMDLFSPAAEAVFQNFKAAGNVNFEFRLEEDSATVGPVLSLFRSRTVDAVDADVIGALYFEGMDDGTPSRTLYAAIAGIIVDSADTSEDGAIVFQTINAGTNAELLRVYADGGAAATTRGVVFENKLASAAAAVQFEFRLTENSATAGPVLCLFRNRTNDAVDNDICGVLQWDAMDDGTPTRTTYAAEYLKIIDSGDTSEDGSLVWDVMQAGTLTAGMRLNNSTSGALEVHASAGTAAKTVGTYDDYDDAMVLRELYPAKPPKDSWAIMQMWERMVEIGVAARKDPRDITKGHMYSVQAMDALLAGGIYQTRARVDVLADEVAELREENASLRARIELLEAA
jgi:hypothetical protein